MKERRPASCGNSIFQIRFLFMGALVFLFHGAKLNSGVIGVDTEDLIHLQEDFYGGWMQTGRQGLVLMKYLLGNQQFHPYFAGAMTILFFAAAVCAFFWLWERMNGSIRLGKAKRGSRESRTSLWACGLGGLLWISHPIMAEQFYFSLQSMEICVCLLLTAAALYLSFRWSQRHGLLDGACSVVLLLWTFSSYQTFVVLYIFGTVTLLLLQALRDVSEGRKRGAGSLFRRVIPYCAVFMMAFVLNTLITRLFFSSSSYLQEQILWGRASVKDCIYGAAAHFVKAFTGLHSIFYHWGLGILALFDLILLICFLKKNTVRCRGMGGVILFYYFALLASPFMMTILLGGSPAIRSQLVLPVFTGFLGYLGIVLLCRLTRNSREMEGKHSVKETRIAKGRLGTAGNVKEGIESGASRVWKAAFVFGAAVCLITGMEQAKVTESLYYTDWCRYEQDAALGRAIIERINQVNGGDETIPVVIIGGREFKGNSSCVTGEVIGRSFFGYDADVSPRFFWSTRRILGFLHTLGADFNQIPESRMEEALEYSLYMPEWPWENSVEETDGMIIVKLSHYEE